MNKESIKTRSVWKTLTIRGLKLLHLLVSGIMFNFCWQWYYDKIYPELYYLPNDIIICILYVLILGLLIHTYDGYSLGYRKVSDNSFSQIISQVLTAGIIWVITILLFRDFTNPLPLIGLCVIQLLWDLLWSYYSNKIYNKIHLRKKTLIIYRDEDDLKRLEEIGHMRHKFDIQQTIKNPKDYYELEPILDNFEAIVVSGVDATVRNGIAKHCIETGILGYFAPHVGDIIMQGARHMRTFSVPILSVRRAQPQLEYLVIKRLADIILSLIAMIVLSPFMLITALAIKLYDKGPALYKQVRLTKDGKEFEILKFRSMRVDAEKDGVARLSTGDNDDRITPVGKIIRKIRFDELPQLWNIFTGDMSIVGPRPERPEIAKQYEEEMPAFNLRLQVKAGLTGYAQVYGKYNTDPHDKLEMDLMYINRMSVIEDFRLMFSTVQVLFMKDSTEGIEKGKTTAK